MYSNNKNKGSEEDLISLSSTNSSSKISKNKKLKESISNSISLDIENVEETNGEYDSETSESQSELTKTTTSSVETQSELEKIKNIQNAIKTEQSLKITKKKKINQKKNKNKKNKSENLYSIGITNFNTSSLKFHKKIQNPRIRITLCDPNTGKILKKAEDEEKNYSFLTNPGQLIDSSSFSFKWPDDAVIFDEEVDYLNSKNLFVLFFELIDNSNTKSPDKWHRIGWSFLRLNTDVTLMKVIKISLQLFKYTKSWRHKKKNLTFKQWSITTKRKVYKGFLNLHLNYNEISVEAKAEFSKPETFSQVKQNEEFSSDINWNGVFNKLQAKIFQNPEKIIFKHRMEKGSTICAFSPEFDLIAYSECLRNLSSINIFDIIILKKRLELQGHEATIHSIEWLKKSDNDYNTLVSCSEDQTCIVWNIKEYSYSILYVLYHPTFVYCATFLSSNESIFNGIATGCRDGVLRIWKKNLKNDDTLQLDQEIKEHKSFIIGLIYNCRNKRLYSAEQSGHIFEWLKQERKNKWLLKKKLLRNVKPLKQFVLCKKLNRIYILTQTNLSSIDLKTYLQHEYLNDICPNDCPLRISLSLCCNWIFLGFRNKIICWNCRSKTIINTLENFCGNITSIDFNPEQNILIMSTISKNYGAPGGGLYVYAPNDYSSTETVTENYPESINRNTKISGNNYFNLFLMKLDNLFDVDIEQNSNKNDKYMKMDKNIYEENHDTKDSSRVSSDTTGGSMKNKTYSIDSNRTFTLSNKNNQTFDIINDNAKEENTFTIKNDKCDDSEATDVSEDLE